jgi:hypothetical protein
MHHRKAINKLCFVHANVAAGAPLQDGRAINNWGNIGTITTSRFLNNIGSGAIASAGFIDQITRNTFDVNSGAQGGDIQNMGGCLYVCIHGGLLCACPRFLAEQPKAEGQAPKM